MRRAAKQEIPCSELQHLMDVLRLPYRTVNDLGAP
jgi:hypothetical protein